MCTMINVCSDITGGGRGAQGWFPVDLLSVGYDHPTYMNLEHAITLDFMNKQQGPAGRVAIELSPDSARQLIATLQNALEQGKYVEV